jgi:hypothetical protein
VSQVQRNAHTSSITSTVVPFPDGRQTILVKALPDASARDIRTALDLIPPAVVAPKAITLIVGGTDLVDGELQARLVQLFCRGLARAVAANGTILIDRSVGSAAIPALSKTLLDCTSNTTLLRIVNDDEITWPDRDHKDGAGSGRRMLEPDYTHVVAVKGTNRDSVLNTTLGLVEEFSQDIPILTILVNDSSTAKEEIVRSVRRAWPTLIISGSGGLADQLQQAWQDKQNYLQALSKWDAGDSHKPRPSSPFIADPALAEVIAEGDLHFFSITDTPENLEQTIDLRLKTDNILSQAQVQRQLYRDEAARQQKIFRRQQFWILLLGVLITALAAFQAFYKQVQWNVPLVSTGSFKLVLGDILYYVLIGLPVVLAVLIAGANRFNHGDKWVALRAASEGFKQEMFRYRTHTGNYSDVQVMKNQTNREAILAKRLQAITTQWLEGDLDYANFPTSVRPGKAQGPQSASNSKVLAQRKPKESVYLQPDRYIVERVVDQLNFYKDRSQKLGRKLTWLQWTILGLGGLATLLAALHFELVITVTTAIVGALVAYLEYNQVANTLKQYNQAILTLTNIQNWWVALGDAQGDPKNINDLVDFVETTLQTEHAGWVQQLQTTLAKLHAQQAKQDGAYSDNKPMNNELENQFSTKSARNSQSVTAATSENASSASSLQVNDSGSDTDDNAEQRINTGYDSEG